MTHFEFECKLLNNISNKQQILEIETLQRYLCPPHSLQHLIQMKRSNAQTISDSQVHSDIITSEFGICSCAVIVW